MRASVFALAVWLSAGCAELITDIDPDRATDAPCQASPEAGNDEFCASAISQDHDGDDDELGRRRFGSRETVTGSR